MTIRHDGPSWRCIVILLELRGTEDSSGHNTVFAEESGLLEELNLFGRPTADLHKIWMSMFVVMTN